MDERITEPTETIETTETTETERPVNPRRRKRSKVQIFKETYLPTIIMAVTMVLIAVFIFGSSYRAIKQGKIDKDESIAASKAAAEEKARLDAEAADILSRAEAKAAGFDYIGAINLIDSFTGKMSEYQELVEKRSEYSNAQDQMVPWSDPTLVTNLSFQMLIADPQRAFNDDVYSDSYYYNFVTVSEFRKMLEQLYANGYILVSLDDFITTAVNGNGETEYTVKTMYLPKGKKPLMLTQTNVNYYGFMIDSDDDGVADKDGGGFASRLVLDANGNLATEYVDAEGNLLIGEYDLVPILEGFIKAHPDFSYNGARAILAVSGYDGVFGYRINSDDSDQDDTTDTTDATDTTTQPPAPVPSENEEVRGAKAIAKALRDRGYVIACYTYDNMAYGGEAMEDLISEDLRLWKNEISPVLGPVDILVFAQESDIDKADKDYSGGAYNILKEAGFRYYLGFCETGSSWIRINSEYVRQGRILVNGTNLEDHDSWFSDLFPVDEVLDAAREEY